ncbi:MAG: hypothetical protein IPF55_18755 [Rhodoferax sp.]|nr:hypothetical protein [Rhodoferax sp.]
MTSHIRPGPLGSSEHDVSRGLSQFRRAHAGQLAHPVLAQVGQTPSALGGTNYPDETPNETRRHLRPRHAAVRASDANTDSDHAETQRLQRRYPASDVTRLVTIFDETVRRMDATSERRPGSGEINGWANNWLGGTGLGPEYLKCADQAAEVMGALALRAQTKAKWRYTFEQRIPGPVPLHVWVKAQSDDPNDPVLHLDAWSNEVRIEPAPGNGSPVKK